jgi:trigger factor
MAGRGKIPGFRPGKAPYDVVLRHYGEAAVYEEAVDLLVDEVYPEMLKEADLKPAAAGRLEKVDGTDNPVFTFKVPLAPEVTLGKYRDLRAPFKFEAPGPERLEQSLDELRQMYATTETVDRAAAEGDYVVVDLQSEPKGLERKETGTVIRMQDRPEEFPFPGFSAKLAGMKAGESKTIAHKFPEDAAISALAGQNAAIEVAVKAVRSMTLPEVDDNLAKMVGPYETVAALKEALQKEIEARARADYEDEYYTALVDKLREQSTIKFAPQTLEHEAGHVVEDMRRRLAQQGLELETYYKMRNTDAAKFLEEEAKPIAQKRLERSLVLEEVARQEKIEVDNSSLDQEFNETLVGLQNQGLNLNSIRGGRQGQQRLAEAVAMQSANRLLTRRTLERLRSFATGKPEPAAAAGSEGQPAAPEKTAGGKSRAAKTPTKTGASSRAKSTGKKGSKQK